MMRRDKTFTVRMLAGPAIVFAFATGANRRWMSASVLVHTASPEHSDWLAHGPWFSWQVPSPPLPGSVKQNWSVAQPEQPSLLQEHDVLRLFIQPPGGK